MTIFRVICWLYFLTIIISPISSIIIFISTESLWKIFNDSTFLNSIFNSFLIATITTILSVIIGTFSGFIISRVKIRYKKLFSALLTLPLFFVPYQSALAWSALLPAGKISHLLFSKVGVIFILTGSFYPIIFWLTYIAFSSIPPEEEESALIISSPEKVFFKITLYKTLPYILSGALLVFLFSFSEVGVATYLGVNVVPYEILMQLSAFYNIHSAFAASIPMGITGLILFIFEYTILKKGLKFYQKVPEQRVLIFDNNVLRYTGICIICLIIILFLLIPLITLLYESLDIKSISIGLRNGAGSLLNSVFYSLLIGFITGWWALFSVYSLNRSTKRLFATGSLFTFFLSPPIIGMGIIYLWQKISHLVYGTILALIFGLLARFSFLSYKIIETAFDNLDPSGKEAAIISGAGWSKTLFKIIFPQIKRWFYLGVMLVFVFSMNELGASIMLYPPGGEPLVVRLYTLSVNTPISISSVLALMNSITTLIFVFLFIRLGIKEKVKK